MMSFTAAWLVSVPVLLGAARGLAEGVVSVDEGSEVAVVYNARVAASGELARYYAERRSVPTNQVLGLPLPEGESMSREEYRRLLAEPLGQALRKLGLLGEGGRLRYLVCCFGVPVKIREEPQLREAGTEALPKGFLRNEAAVDSELAALAMSAPDFLLTGPRANPVYGATNAGGIGGGAGILMAARLDGPTVAAARRLVDQALEAESVGLWGRAYVDLRGLTNGGLMLGEQWLAGAAQVMRSAGFETVVDTNATTFPRAFPMSDVALYAGWYDAEVSGPFLQRPEAVEMRPGAFAYHLHSFSALQLRTADRHWAGPLVDRGAAATVGYTAEPYLQATLDLPAFFARWILNGESLGEAVYAALPVVSWQVTVVGDPLYRPFGRSTPGEPLGHRFRDLHFRLLEQTNALIEWSHLQVVNLGLAQGNGQASQEVRDYLAEQAGALGSAVLYEKEGSLELGRGRLDAAIRAYAKALEGHCSRQQRIRLMLELAQLRDLYTQDVEALQLYEEFLRLFPDYPDRDAVVREALVLARELGQQETAARLESDLGSGRGG